MFHHALLGFHHGISQYNFDYDVKHDEKEAQCDQIDPDIKIHLCKPSIFTNCSKQQICRLFLTAPVIVGHVGVVTPSERRRQRSCEERFSLFGTRCRTFLHPSACLSVEYP